MSSIMNMPEDELRALIDDLTLYATRKVKKLLWRGVRVAPEDMVQEAIQDHLDGRRRWNREKHANLNEFLRSVIDSKVSHRVERHDNAKVRMVDPVGPECGAVVEQLTDDWRPDLRAIQREEASASFQAAAHAAVIASDPKIGLVMECLQAGLTRAQIAEYLEIAPTEYDAIRKRLQRKLDPLRGDQLKRSRP